MPKPDTEAQRLLSGDRGALARVAAAPLAIRKDNLVPRPWGGDQLAHLKGLTTSLKTRGGPFGESFEIAADDGDAEARRHPSQVLLADGSQISLPRLLERAGETILGADMVARHGARFPLLPKLLNVKELLSVQGHPAGHTEVYIIIAAEAGATLRLGFSRDMDGDALAARLRSGRREQTRLLEALGPGVDAAAVQKVVAPALASGAMDGAALAAALSRATGSRVDRAALARHLGVLNDVYWWMLDAMNALPVTPGQVIYNRTPARLLAAGAQPSAEVHALGNPEGREILALEIRRPGPTFRAWDNVRFPVRAVDVDRAVAAINLRATLPQEFRVTPEPLPDHPGRWRSAEGTFFRIEHLKPRPGEPVTVERGGLHGLHGIAGAATLSGSDGVARRIAAGESLLMPVSVERYTLGAAEAGVQVIKVDVRAGGSASGARARVGGWV